MPKWLTLVFAFYNFEEQNKLEMSKCWQEIILFSYNYVNFVDD